MIKVAALTSGKLVPSTRFRVRQHIQDLNKLGIEVREYVPIINKYMPIPLWPKGLSPKYGLPFYGVWQGIKVVSRIPGLIGSWRNQITWLERQLLPGYLTLEPFLKNPLVFDVDDAIWHSRPFGKSSVSAIAKKADIVVAGNNYLAEWFSKYSKDVRVIPTAVNTERFKPNPLKLKNKDQSKRFVIGWIGSSGNLGYLEAIETALKRFLTNYRDSEILIIADRKPAFTSLPDNQVRYLSWSIDNEVKAVQQMDVGLMPLPDNEWTRGKCSFKMLQYMACGIPVVVSPVGMNSEVLALGQLGLPAVNQSDWYEALSYFYKNRDYINEYGRNGRLVVEKFFSQNVISNQIAKVFKELT